MLEYTFEEAKDLLSSKLNTAKTSLKNTIEDLEFLRDQITTMEVSKYRCNAYLIIRSGHLKATSLDTARVYNWDVKQRRLAREQKA